MKVAFDLQEPSKARSNTFTRLIRLMSRGTSDASSYYLFVRVTLAAQEQAIVREYGLDLLTIWKGPAAFSLDRKGRSLRSYPFLVVGTQLLEDSPILLTRASTRSEANDAMEDFSASLRAYRLKIMDFDYDGMLMPINPAPANSSLEFTI